MYSTCIYGNVLLAPVGGTLAVCQISIVLYNSTINIIQSFQILQHDEKYNEIYFCVLSTKAWVSTDNDCELWTLELASWVFQGWLHVTPTCNPSVDQCQGSGFKAGNLVRF
jgi:hypothetical protein